MEQCQCVKTQWRHICDDNWTLDDATVACKQLGHGAAGWLIHHWLYVSNNYILCSFKWDSQPENPYEALPYTL